MPRTDLIVRCAHPVGVVSDEDEFHSPGVRRSALLVAASSRRSVKSSNGRDDDRTFHRRTQMDGWFQSRITSILLVTMVMTFLPLVLGEPRATASTAVHTEATTPDFTNPRLVLNLVVLLVWFPFASVIVFLEYRRRHRFPIAGRGSNYLLVLAVKHLISIPMITAIALIYPVGAPCGMQVIAFFLFTSPTTVLYLIRGITLVFRIEIMNFLAETRWREEKRAMLREHQEKMAELAAAEGGATDAAATKLGGATADTKLLVSDEPDAPETIPGYFFLQHRRWIEPAFMYQRAAILTAITMVGLVIICAFDPDIRLTDVDFRSRGLIGPDETTGSQFSPDGFGTAPVCLVYSAKMLFFQGLLCVSMFPGSNWCVLRLIIDRKRRLARRKEQEDLYRQLHGEEMPVPTPTAGVDLDDSRKVKIELGLFFLATGGCCCIYYPTQMYEPGYGLDVLLLVNMFTFLISHVSPVYLSFDVERRLRKHFGRARADSSSSAEKGDGYTRKDLSAQLAHQRPYYSLRFILRNPQTYPVLLTFLQKEFSSENAMFYAEAREFERDAKAMETRIPSWPSATDDDDGGMTGTAIRSSLRAANSIIGAPANKHHTHAQSIASTASPPHLTRLVSNTVTAGLKSTDISSMEPVGGSVVQMMSTLPSPANKYRAVAPSPTSQQTACNSLVRPPVPLAPSSRAQPVPQTGATPFVPTISPSLEAPPTPVARTPMTISIVTTTAEPVDFASLRSEAHRLKTWAKKISDEYLHRSAMYEINIPEDLSKLVASQIAQLESWQPTPIVNESGEPIDPKSYPVPPPFPLSTLFKQAQLEVFDLIQRDSFRRFILTSEFARLLQHADEEELARIEREGNLVHTYGEKDALDKALGASPKLATGVAMTPLLAVGRRAHSRSGSIPKDASRVVTEDELVGTPSTVPPRDEEYELRLPGVPLEPVTASPTRTNTSPIVTRAGLAGGAGGAGRAVKRQTQYSRVDEEPLCLQGSSDAESPMTLPARSRAITLDISPIE